MVYIFIYLKLANLIEKILNANNLVPFYWYAIIYFNPFFIFIIYKK